MNATIKGKVAKILTSRELVLNVGFDDGVSEGMYFAVLDPKGEDIQDPDTGEILGSVDRPKVHVRVTRVEPRLCVAETFKSKRVNVGGSGTGFGGWGGLSSITEQLLPPRWITKYETLKTTEKTWEDVSESECYVKTGDPVIQIPSPTDVEDLSESVED